MVLKRKAAKFAIAVVSVVVSFFIFEAVLRIFETAAFYSGQIQLEGDINLEDLNYNDSTLTGKKEKDEYRILSIGDSFAYSIVRYPYSYHGVAQRILRKKLKKKIRIVNLGEPAISFDGYMRMYSFWRSKLEHDAVVFNIYLGNDIIESARKPAGDDVPKSGHLSSLSINLTTGKNRIGMIPKTHIFRIFDYIKACLLTRGKSIEKSSEAGHGPYNYAVSNLSIEEYYKALRRELRSIKTKRVKDFLIGYRNLVVFLKFASQIESAGKKVIVILSPSEIQVDADKRELVARRFGLKSVEFDPELPDYLVWKIGQAVSPTTRIISLYYPLLCASKEQQDLYYGTDTHWTTLGNKLVGEVLAKAISEYFFGKENVIEKDVQRCVRMDVIPEQKEGYLEIYKQHIEGNAVNNY